MCVTALIEIKKKNHDMIFYIEKKQQHIFTEFHCALKQDQRMYW